MNECDTVSNNLDRLNELYSTELLGTAPEDAFTRLNVLATKVLKAPISIFSLIDKDHLFFKSAAGFEITPENNTMPMDASVCRYTLKGVPLVIEDTATSPIFHDNPSVKALNIVGYLGIPLITRNGYPIGGVCVIDHKVRRWTQEEISILEELTNSFMSEIELRKSVRLAQSEIQQRKEFVSIASHELKNPISAMMLHSQFQEMSLDKNEMSQEKIRKYLNRAQSQLKNLNRMIDDMSDVSRLESGKLSLYKQTMDLGNLVRSSLEYYSPLLKNVKVESIIENNIIGKWDAFRIEQVLGNLFINASKYSLEKPIYVEVRKIENYACVSVRDEGPGIPSGHEEKIFEKYSRVNDNGSVKGLGLGLYLARQIAEDHGGKLQLAPSVIGARFELHLPI